MAWQVALYAARADRQVCRSFPQSQYSSTPGKTGVRAPCQGGGNNGAPNIYQLTLLHACVICGHFLYQDIISIECTVVTANWYSVKMSGV